ncbi:hypothetical protein [Bacillus changyiensis]|uniref:hypothetical protein n=1 Tax=Bacillus changyiensis TaxID=3004103 RepID=UPI0022E28C02|nr:hypothetical protein [Bacillus changyiensis]MDA1478019.1 hypothetical protein [Bacillus changyiensis]
MKFQKTLTVLILIIVVFAVFAATIGIFSEGGPGEFEMTSVRGETVLIYGKGIYKHMSSEVAIQGIAQDGVTLLVAVPLLLLSLFLSRRGSVKARLMLSGTLLYFLLTYLFYLVMAMYNQLFLVYIILLTASFFSFVLSILSHDWNLGKSIFRNQLSVKLIGGFLIFNAILIGGMWLSIIVYPLINGKYPETLEHYTTLPVQGLDLALFLPLSFLSGLFVIQKKPVGYIGSAIYLVFLSLIMIALLSKILFAIFVNGADGIPAIIIIPVINLVTIILAVYTIKSVKEENI